MNTPQNPQKRARLWLVDDDRLVLTTLALSLEHAGYDVTTFEATDDVEALLASGARPDLAILDIRMPGRNGLDLAQRLHELDHIPFMMLSAYSDAATVSQATHHGALGYLVKPLDTAQLLPGIRAALARADELQSLREVRRQLQVALDDDRHISVAVGVTIVQHQLSRQAAFERLRQLARARRSRLAELAVQVIHAAEPPHTDTPRSPS